MRSFLRLSRWAIFIAAMFIVCAAWNRAQTRSIEDLHLVLVAIPAGSFVMGSPAGEAGRYDNEGPQTRVTISHAFWLGRTTVTQAQWRAVMGTTVEEQARKMLADDAIYDFGSWGHTTVRDNLRRRDGDEVLLGHVGDDVPMYWINWDEAVEYCRRLTNRERAAGRLPPGYEYRLPTEAEWEYACRAGTTTATYAGELELKDLRNAPVLDPIAWYAGNSSVDYKSTGHDTAHWTGKQYPGGIAGQHPVALKQPNAWDLCDMIGNVCNWCSVWYGERLPGGEVKDPTGPASGVFKIVRGGSWFGFARWCRSAHRFTEQPGFRDSDIGLRVALAPIRPAAGLETRTIADLGLELRPIPAGVFMMGSPNTEKGRGEWEGPQQRVVLTRSFWLGATPVTQGQWRQVMGIDLEENLRQTLADERRHAFGAKKEMLTYRERVQRRYKTESIEALCFGRGDNLPMIWVDWDQAVEFCRRLTERERQAGRLSTDYEFRLPTEAEREYACRSGTTTATYAGDVVLQDANHAPLLDEIGWYAGNSGNGLHAVALKSPNAWGLYDMIGNVDEWTLDWYAPPLPQGADPIGPSTGEERVFRGGSWQNSPLQLRAAARYTGRPDFRDADVGLRVALCPVGSARP